MNWNAWLYGLLSAVLSSAGGAVAVVIADPLTFNLDEGLVPLLKVTAVSAFGNTLNTTPLPKQEGLQGP
jgi:uncharacterized protein (DUF697 family)